jgi:hypothetical protein
MQRAEKLGRETLSAPEQMDRAAARDSSYATHPPGRTPRIRAGGEHAHAIQQTSMTKQVITVFGGTGLQGGGVVNALLGARLGLALLVVSGVERMRRRQLGGHSRWSARQDQGRPTRHSDLFAIGVEHLGRADGNGATAVNDPSLCH